MLKYWRSAEGISPFGAHILVTFATNILILGISLVTAVISARILGPEGRGELAVIQLWPFLLTSVAALGLPEALVFFSAREKDKAGELLGSAMLLTFVSSLIFVGVGYLIIQFFLVDQTSEVQVIAKFNLSLIPIIALAGMPLFALRGRNDLIVWNFLRVLPNLSWAVVLAVFFFQGVQDPGLVSYGFIVAIGLLLIPVFLIVSKRLADKIWFSLARWKPMLSYGLPNLISGVPKILNSRVDQILMVAVVTPKDFGLYIVALGWSSAVTPLLSAYASVLFPRMASSQDSENQYKIISQGSRAGLFVAISSAFIISALTPFLLPMFFGAGFQRSVPLGIILIFSGAFVGYNLILEEGMRGLGIPSSIIWAETFGLIGTVFLLYFSVRSFGVVGAAFATLSGNLLTSLYLVWRLVDYFISKPLASFLLPRREDYLIVMDRIYTFVNLKKSKSKS